ncbi:MAG: hypothetical protein ACLU9S_23375 [Oscillospiraceae bacterium]
MSEAIDVITGETEVSTTELACVLGITGRRIRQMAEDGQLQKVSKGRFLLADSVQRYVKFLSDGPMDEEDKKLEKTRRVAETTMKASKATIAKLEAEELKGKMHRSGGRGRDDYRLDLCHSRGDRYAARPPGRGRGLGELPSGGRRDYPHARSARPCGSCPITAMTQRNTRSASGSGGRGS